ncbi:MAG TPA: hypothetical protein VGG35_14620 [Streptosporangiaceae bacterium]|jgi:hypothetical protein
MTTWIRPRLRKPLVLALAGTLLAASWIVRGGATWWFCIAIEIPVLVQAVTMYVRAGQDSDEGALAGSRADERQQQIGLRSRALAGRAMTAVALAGLIAAIAVHGNWWWPFLVILAAGSVGYLFGLSAYSVGAEGAATEPDTGYPAPL